MRYVLEVPKTVNAEILEIAEYEEVHPRTILIWLLKAEIAEHLRSIRAPQAAAA